MSVQIESVVRIMGWLSEGSEARSANSNAELLAERLTAVVFKDDRNWPQRIDQAGDFADVLSRWFVGDITLEYEFADLTKQGAEPGPFIDWFLPVVEKWQRNDAQAGLPNPNSDGTPGTEYYRFDEAGARYLYADSARSADWATYEVRRYSEPAYNDEYGLDYRLDRTRQCYEWFDEATATWRDQAWANLYAVQMQSVEPDGAAPPPWDEQWAMFYRVGSDGGHEFADAVTPGDWTTGCTEVWFSSEQVLQQRAVTAVRVEPATQAEALREIIRCRIPGIETLVPGFDDLSDDEIAETVETFLKITGSN